MTDLFRPGKLLAFLSRGWCGCSLHHKHEPLLDDTSKQTQITTFCTLELEVGAVGRGCPCVEAEAAALA